MEVSSIEMSGVPSEGGEGDEGAAEIVVCSSMTVVTNGSDESDRVWAAGRVGVLIGVTNEICGISCGVSELALFMFIFAPHPTRKLIF